MLSERGNISVIVGVTAIAFTVDDLKKIINFNLLFSFYIFICFNLSIIPVLVYDTGSIKNNKFFECIYFLHYLDKIEK